MTRWLKLAIAFLCLYFVYRQIDRQAWAMHISNMHWGWALVAIICLLVSQTIGGLRMQFFLCVRGVLCEVGTAVCLYYRGMLYNLVLPGGISGDGYRVYALRQRYPQLSVLDLLRMVFSERANGLFILALILLSLLAFIPERPYPRLALPLVALLGFIGYGLMLRFALKETTRAAFLAATCYSLPLQFFSLLAAISITISLSPHYDLALLHCSAIVFLAASIAATIPITLGGLGMREIVFMAGFAWCGYPESLGVAIASLYYLCYLVVAVSAGGISTLIKSEKHSLK